MEQTTTTLRNFAAEIAALKAEREVHLAVASLVKEMLAADVDKLRSAADEKLPYVEINALRTHKDILVAYRDGAQGRINEIGEQIKQTHSEAAIARQM